MQTVLGERMGPLICTPVTGATRKEILTQLERVVSKGPDVIEWRADFFQEVHREGEVLALLEEMKAKIEGIPLLFTLRSAREGGADVPLSEEERVALICKVCATSFVELVDYEVLNDGEHIRRIRDVSRKEDKKLILSYHNFKETPGRTELIKYMMLMHFYGADGAKVAVMPRTKADVFTLLEATKEASQSLSIPLITISMGELGAMSRIMGWYYGSSLTFAVGEQSSAPGQVPIEDLKLMIQLAQKYVPN